MRHSCRLSGVSGKKKVLQNFHQNFSRLKISDRLFENVVEGGRVDGEQLLDRRHSKPDPELKLGVPDSGIQLLARI
jgi:hypothetical protein